tara:strand:- start:1246 stop:1455 length:210 start_codon:yes stop_codon:yes gene_type:complete
MGSFLGNLKKVMSNDKRLSSRRWILKYNNQDRIKEIKLIYKPSEYDGSRTLLNDKQLVNKLEREKQLKL